MATSLSERQFEARALAVHYFSHGGLPFASRTAMLAVVVDAEDEIARLRGALSEWLAASEALKVVDTSDGQAIKAALARVDAAKADARGLVR